MENDLKLELSKEDTSEFFIDQKTVTLIDSLIPMVMEEKVEPMILPVDIVLQSLSDQPTILEGKRSRKPTARLEVSTLTPSKKPLIIPQGHGQALGQIEHINKRLSHATTDTLSRMNQICFGRRGVKNTIRKNLRQFQGFDFDYHSDGYRRHLKYLAKLKKHQLRSIAELLGLLTGGRNDELAERILDFLMKPTDQVTTSRSSRKSASVRTIKQRKTVSKRTKNSEKPSVEPDATILMNCQVKLDDLVQQIDSNLVNATSLPDEPTEDENSINISHHQTDQSDVNLVIDENPRTDDTNADKSF